MTHPEKDTREENGDQERFDMMQRENLQQTVRTALASVFEVEVDASIGATQYEFSELVHKWVAFQPQAWLLFLLSRCGLRCLLRTTSNKRLS